MSRNGATPPPPLAMVTILCTLWQLIYTKKPIVNQSVDRSYFCRMSLTNARARVYPHRFSHAELRLRPLIPGSIRHYIHQTGQIKILISITEADPAGHNSEAWIDGRTIAPGLPLLAP